MSYYDPDIENATDPDVKLGRQIYMEALAHRRGFRDDQLGIDDPSIWAEIFIELAQVARAQVKTEKENKT